MPDTVEKGEESIVALLKETHMARMVLLSNCMESTNAMAREVWSARVAGVEGRSKEADNLWDVISKTGTTDVFKQMMADLFSVIVGERVQPETSNVTLVSYPFAMIVPIKSKKSADHGYPVDKIAVVNKNGDNSGALRPSNAKGGTFMQSSEDLFRYWRLPTETHIIEYFMAGDAGGPTVKQIESFFGSIQLSDIPSVSVEIMATGIVERTREWAEINAALDVMFADEEDGDKKK